MPVWTEDEAGPYQAIPQPGTHWRPATSPARYPHEHIRHGTAKLLTLFHPASGQVRVKGVTSAANGVVHPWLEAELTGILATLPEPPIQSDAERRAAWERWQVTVVNPLTFGIRVDQTRTAASSTVCRWMAAFATGAVAPKSRPATPSVTDDAGIGDEFVVLTPEGAELLAAQREQAVAVALTTYASLYPTCRVDGCQYDPEPHERDCYRHMLVNAFSEDARAGA